MDILKAIETETLSKIKELVKSEDASFFSSYYSYKALNRALESGRKDVAKFLLSDSRCMVNRSNNTSDMTNSNTPMHNAVKLGDIEIVDTLLKRGASISIINSDGDSPLHLAFLRRYEGIVDRMLSHIEKTLNYKNVKNKDGLTHLHIACTRTNKKVIVGFLKAKANITDIFDKNSPSSWAGYTAMHFAVEFKSAEAVAILSTVASGDSAFNSEASNGQTPLQLAREYLENLMIATDRLENREKSMSYFHLACLKDDVSVVKKFIENGANVHSRVNWLSDVCSDYLPLDCALESVVDRTEKVKLLLKHGATVERCYDEEDMTPLHLALYTEATDTKGNPINLLYDALADKKDNIMDKNGLTVFHIAVTRNDFETVKYHLDNGVDVNLVLKDNSRFYSNYSALHFAIHFKHLEMAKFLIERGADVNVNFGKSNYTPLFPAVEGDIKGNDFNFIELLLKHGARVDVVYCKKTPLHHIVTPFITANEDDQAKILMYAEMFVYMGVDVNAADDLELTALHNLWWSFEKCAPCAKLLLELGADINVKARDVGYPFEAFRGSDCSSEECMTFMRHVKKLTALGWYVCPKNQKSCEIICETMDKQELVDIDKELNDEITMLKSTKVTSHLSLYEFLMLDSKRAAAYVQSGILKRIIEDVDVGERFVAYGYLIKLQYRKALNVQM